MVVVAPGITNKVTPCIGLSSTNCSYNMFITAGNLNHRVTMEIPHRQWDRASCYTKLSIITLLRAISPHPQGTKTVYGE
jgi:hypothetical protein